MTDVEDVAGTPGGAVEDGLGAALDGGPIAVQRHRVEVALYRDVVPVLRPSVIQVDAPVKAQHVSAGLPQQGQQAIHVGAEIDNRRQFGRARRGSFGEQRPRLVNRRLGVGQHIFGVIFRAERTGPRVENLHQVGPSFNLGHQINRHQVGQFRHQRVPTGRVVVHHRFGAAIIFAAATLNRVARQREGRTAEAKQRRFSGQRGLHQLQRLERVARGFVGIVGAQRRDVGGGANGIVDDGAFTLFKGKLNAQTFERRQNVGENDRGVHAERLNRLERHLGGDLRELDHLHEAVALTHGPVHRHITARLTHQPKRRSIRRLLPTGL